MNHGPSEWTYSCPEEFELYLPIYKDSHEKGFRFTSIAPRYEPYPPYLPSRAMLLLENESASIYLYLPMKCSTKNENPPYASITTAGMMRSGSKALQSLISVEMMV